MDQLIQIRDKLSEEGDRLKHVMEERYKIYKSLEPNVIELQNCMHRLETLADTEDNLFDAFHAIKEGNIYRVKKEEINIYLKCEKDRIYTEEEFDKLETVITEYFHQPNFFSVDFGWQDYHGVELNLTNNLKLYKILEDLANKGNIYVTDFLIFHMLKMGQYLDHSYTEKAKQLYYLVPEPTVLPYNLIYRAILFQEYAELVKEYSLDSHRLFSCWYEWNLDKHALSDEIKKQNIFFEDERDQMMAWFASL